MSDSSQGPGWWQASDGRWYPPEQHPSYAAASTSLPPTVAQPPAATHSATVPPGTPPNPWGGPPASQGQWASAPLQPGAEPTQHVVKVKQRPGCFTTGLAVIGGLVILVILVSIIVAVAGGGADSTSTRTATPGAPPTTAAPPEGTLFPGRPDSQPDDLERPIGGAATIEGLEATVTAATFVQSIDPFQNDGYIKATITVRNTGSDARPYSAFQFRYQTTNGEVLDPLITAPQTLNTGDLVPGGTASGEVIFEARTPAGFIIWKPNPFDASRGIWPVG